MSAEEEAVGFASEWKFEHSRIFKKELPFFRKEEFVGREIELNDVYIGIGKVSVGGEVRNKIRTNTNFCIHATRMLNGCARFQPAANRGWWQVPEAAEHVWLDDQQPPAADVGNAL